MKFHGILRILVNILSRPGISDLVRTFEWSETLTRSSTIRCYRGKSERLQLEVYARKMKGKTE